MNNPWADSDIHHHTEAARLDWLWTVLYGQLRDMLGTLPAPVHLPHLDADAGAPERARAAALLERAAEHLHGQEIPADIRTVADLALTDGAMAANLPHHGERRDMITRAQARARAVTAYTGVEPDDFGVSWEDMASQDR